LRFSTIPFCPFWANAAWANAPNARDKHTHPTAAAFLITAWNPQAQTRFETT
jgi:hypothetical protein